MIDTEIWILVFGVIKKDAEVSLFVFDIVPTSFVLQVEKCSIVESLFHYGCGCNCTSCFD